MVNRDNIGIMAHVVHGIYEIQVKNKTFGRLRGTSGIVSIDKIRSGSSLRTLLGDPNGIRAMRLLMQDGHKFDFRWLSLRSTKAAEVAYQWRLKRYITEHWEQPSHHKIPDGSDPQRAKRILYKQFCWPLRSSLVETFRCATKLEEDTSLDQDEVAKLVKTLSVETSEEWSQWHEYPEN